MLADLCRQMKDEPLSGPTVEHGDLTSGLEILGDR